LLLASFAEDFRMRPSPIRVIRANPDHSPFLARAILSASRSQLERGPFDVALGLDTADVLDLLEYMCLSDLVGNCHFSNFFVAEMAGEPVAALAAYDPGDSGVLPLGAPFSDAYSALGHDEEKLPFVLGCLEAVQRCLPPPQPGIWTVEWVAVEESLRRQGIISLLLQKAIDAGADRSLQQSQVSTYVGNEAAINAYAKAGYRVDRERHNPALATLLGISGMVTMVRELPAPASDIKSRYTRRSADVTIFLTCHVSEAVAEAAQFGQSVMMLV
jgi:ribosomal protein S18 acetylase RimI-like enzyme